MEALNKIKELNKDVGDLKCIKNELAEVLREYIELRSHNAKLSQRLEELEQ